MASHDADDYLSEKLPDQVLRQFVDESTDERMSVIVELNLPPQEISLSRSESNQYPIEYSIRKVLEESPAQQKDNERKIQKAHKFMESLLGETPRWLNSARAFVVSVTPEQLRSIAASPLTKTIRPNRRLQKTG